MDHRAPLGARPRPPQRSVTSAGSYGVPQLPKRPSIGPSRLSSSRSVSQPADLVDLTAGGWDPAEDGSRLGFGGREEEMVRSPETVELFEGEEGEPPAKRARLADEGQLDVGNAIRGGQEKEEQQHDKAYETHPGSPLPDLPPRSKPTKRSQPQRRFCSVVEPAARKAHGLAPPAAATRLPPPKKAADFYPWTGNSAEDILNETVVKVGFFDKPPQASTSESNSAKPTIWPQLTQKNALGYQALHTLSWAFAQVMDRRAQLGKCTAPSTFKPPPRVTVTDTKREAWLKDLANPEIPLRKQSRTIPHGIRGKLLMEQCLSKDIPLPRAVWLAKCVGANELRAFRRKGVSGPAAASGEAKWVREWTVNVEQFIESIIAMCGQEDWQAKMNYAVKLGTALYAEKLLDVDHYLNWIVSSLAGATIERLPIWVIMAQIYWKGITTYGRRGRRLAEGILEHLRSLAAMTSEAHAPLKTRLQKLVVVLAHSDRSCLILPRTWEKYKDLLTLQFGFPMSSEAQAKKIAKRNERLAGPLHKTAANTRSPLLDLYSKLDTIGLDIDIQELLAACSSLIPSPQQLLPALLDWASTPYRIGAARIYLAARLIASLRSNAGNLDDIVLDYLASADPKTASAENIYRVIIELVRLKAFSTGQYLQWLIASGVLYTAEQHSLAKSLIAALPTADLPTHVLNTRKTLMSRLGHALDEQGEVDAALERIGDAITRTSSENLDALELGENLTLSARLSICQPMCAKLAATAKKFGLGLGAFCVAREVVEWIGDLVSLASLINVVIATDNAAMLATAVDTINLHANSFAALGELETLLTSVTERYLVIRSQQPPDRPLIIALSNLVNRIPSIASFTKLLTDDLAICEQQTSAAVCSPASDSLIAMHGTRIESDADIDGVFASGNTMDELLMQRVFMRIIARALQQPASPPSPGRGQEAVMSRVGEWLAQLRAVDGSGTFEKVVAEYLRSVLSGDGASGLSLDSIVVLVATGCVALGVVADMANDVASPRLAAALLQLFLSCGKTADGLHAVEKFRFRLQQERCQVEHPDSLNVLLRTACEAQDYAADAPTDVIDFVIRCVCLKPGSVRRVFEDAASSPQLQSNALCLNARILRRSDEEADRKMVPHVGLTVEQASPLSVSFSVGTLQYIIPSKDQGQPTFDEDLEHSIRKAFETGSEVWPQLLEFAGVKISAALHNWIFERLIAEDVLESNDAVKRCLDLLAITNKAAVGTDDSARVATVTERVQELLRLLSDADDVEEVASQEDISVWRRLEVTLHLCVLLLHKVSNESDASRQSKHALLAALCSLLVFPQLQTHQEIVEYVFDLASALSDNLAESPHGVPKPPIQTSLPADGRLTSILGSSRTTASADSWLALTYHVHPLGSSSQQQRALNKHALSQQQQQQQQHDTSSPQQNIPTSNLMTQLQNKYANFPTPDRAASGNTGRAGATALKIPVETKTVPFLLRRWEIMSDPAPAMGENDTSLSLGLFGARKVV